MERRMKPPLMLKDFLMQDFSSCSSNGFKSFPRRQCCSSGPLFLLAHKDHSINNFNKNPKTRKSSSSSKPFHQRTRASSSSKISALQAVINAVKNLPVPSSSAVKSPSLRNGKKSFSLTRSLSRKLFRKSFWKRGEEVVAREKFKPLSFKHSTVEVKAADSTETTAVIGDGASSSENWSDDSESTSANSGSFSGESSNFVGKDQIFEGCKEDEKLSNSDATDTCLVEDKSAKRWQIDEEKEQFSPVSILDCPFEDEKTCSPFRSRLTRFKPIDLQKRLALSESDGDETSNSSEQSSPVLVEDEAVSIAQEAQNLLKLITSSNLMLKVNDVLLLDFLMEKLEGRRAKSVGGGEELNKKLMKVVEDYIIGNQNGALVDWKVEKGRIEYVKHMEEDGTKCWKKFEAEKEEMIGEVEGGIWNTLIDDLLVDFF